MKKTTAYLQGKKRKGEKIAVLTAYDYPTAAALETAGVDVILVGDSVGTNVLGYSSPTEVTTADMAHHLKAVRRAVSTAFLLVDLPFGSYDTAENALKSSQFLMSLGADAVKLEGPEFATIRHLTTNGIAVWAHLGLQPQIHSRHSVQGRDPSAAIRILQDSLNVVESGAVALLLELIPEELGAEITRQITVPTIGIGAGRYTDGQVLVINDVVGLATRTFRHNRQYEDFGKRLGQAARQYVDDITSRDFPGSQNAFHMSEDDHAAFLDLAGKR